ncbi:hypothetical protein SAMN04487950_2272 [Halogranum rubrum]|uniref:Uncharacterized protein n=2 Tax=Halogranum rubrum TaxID=553466 RepID=A0A1I4EM98_9EURY|nr:MULTISPECIES: hypothetical protein [Halogranum]EJN60356.1 hypothetical protein HSB1_09590 [Halogranum salarium B-1]SFL06855.1 hypothetical protein SAMN04487950_2272 [Halogranum rubrum]
MNESVVWGGIGVLLAIGGLGIIAPEFLHELQTHGPGSPIALYGIGVVVAVLLTILIVVPSVIAGE